jgi:hypothetical protein
MLNKRKTAVYILIFFILACTLSCTGKKDSKNADKTQSDKHAVIETKDTVIETQDIYSDWVISDDFRNVNHEDSSEKTWDSIEKYIKEVYDKKLISIQPVKIPPFYPDWSGLAFFADFRLQTKDHISNFPDIYLFVFDEDNGLIHYYDSIMIEYWCANGVFPISSNAGLGFKYFWIKDMPFRQLGDKFLIGDFNDDGYDEIILFNSDEEDPFGGTILFSIYGFTKETKLGIGYKPIFEVPIRLFISDRTWDFGPPIQFGAYKGIEGFIIYEDVPTGETGRQWVGLDPDEPFYDDWYEEYQVTEGIWNFYAWNKEEKKYVLIDRVKPDEIKTQWAKN